MITGIGGQDGSYLAELLLAARLRGLRRRAACAFGSDTRTSSRSVSASSCSRPTCSTSCSLVRALESCRPHEVYNLASVSFVPMSWEQPVLTAEFAAVGVTTMLESIRAVDDGIRFYQASSSEIFGEPARGAADASGRRSPRSRPTAWRRPTGTSSRAATGGATACTPRPGSSTTTSRRAGRSTSSPRKVAQRRRGDQARAARARSGSATSTRGATGATRRLRAGDVADAPAGRAGRLRDRHRRDAQRPGARRRGLRACRAGAETSTSTSTARSSVARPSCTTSSATRRRRGSGLAGSRRSASRSSSSLLVDADLERLAAQHPGPGRGFVAGGLRTRRLHESRLAVGAYRQFRRVLSRLGLQVVLKSFYSPIPDLAALPDSTWERRSELAGIRLRPFDAQLAFLERYRRS